MIRVWLALAVLAALATPASADTRRVAVIVGNNTGGRSETPLHYAETDAAKMGRVLAELGGVDARDLFVLQGKSAGELRAVLATARQRVAELEQESGTRVVLIFYFSGHSDGVVLELGGDRLSYRELREWLESTRANVRLAVIDSCKSGGLTVKGGTPGPAFRIRLNDELESSGEAVITSSAADEVALESPEIGGSFFTHHLVSGLRGAADISGDGVVTLAEAYRYAYEHTIATTGETLLGPQHPSYDYRLSGQGELAITELSRPTATLRLPAGFSRVLVVDSGRDQVIAELSTDTRPSIAVPPGRYRVRAWRDGKSFAASVDVAGQQQRVISWNELAPVAEAELVTKGGGSARGIAFEAAGGVAGGVATHLGPISSLRVGASARAASGPFVAIVLDTGRGTNFRESAGFALGGYRLGLERGGVRGWLGLAAGVGLATQSLDTGTGVVTGSLVLAPSAGIAIELGPHLSATALGQLATALLKRDGATTLVELPAVWLGIAITR